MIAAAENVLVVAAHPDDEILGVGGTIPKIKTRGGSVTVLIVTDGSTTQYPDDDEVLIRKKEQTLRANAILGTDRVIHWQFPDMRLDTVEHHHLNEALGALIQDERYDTVFVHGSSDMNLDHRIIHHATLVAVRPFPDQPVSRLFSYHVNSSTEWGALGEGVAFAPNVFIDIETTIQAKLDAMAAYVDELRDYPHPRSLQALHERAAVCGTVVGLRFAEPFRLLYYRDRN